MSGHPGSMIPGVRLQWLGRSARCRQLALIGSDRRPSDFPLFMEDLPCLDGARSSWFDWFDQ